MIKAIEKYGAQWCGPCHVLDNTLKLVTDVEVIKYDIDGEGMDEICTELKIRNIPVMIFRDENGKEVDRTVGAVSLETINKILDKHGRQG